MPDAGAQHGPPAPLSTVTLWNSYVLQGLCEGVEQMVGQLTPYLYQKRGIYYFSRRVPEDLLNHYSRSKIVFSLFLTLFSILVSFSRHDLILKRFWQIATITGHKDLRMLQRYTHLRAEDLAKKLG